jgi:hypothetical protein
MDQMPIEPPDRFAPLEEWDAFLRALEDLPADRPMRAQLIRRTRIIIAALRRAEERARDEPIGALIDPPPMFASVETWRRFLESMLSAPPSMMFRDKLIRRARTEIAELKARRDPYAEAERRGSWLRRARDATDWCPERPRPPGATDATGNRSLDRVSLEDSLNRLTNRRR